MPRKKSIREQVRDMEKKQRASTAKKVEVKLVKSEPEASISFEQWWMLVNKKMDFKPWLKEVMKADFKSRGLGANEKESAFNAALEKFGYRLP
jgi:hypothetical protein